MTETETKVVTLSKVRPGRGVAAPRRYTLDDALIGNAMVKGAVLRREAHHESLVAIWIGLDDPQLAAAYDVLAAAKIALADELERQ